MPYARGPQQPFPSRFHPPAAEALAGDECVCQVQFVDWLVLEAGRGSRRGPSLGFCGESVHWCWRSWKQIERPQSGCSDGVLSGTPPGLLSFSLVLTVIVSVVSKCATFETICRNCQPKCKSGYGVFSISNTELLINKGYVYRTLKISLGKKKQKGDFMRFACD